MNAGFQAQQHHAGGAGGRHALAGNLFRPENMFPVRSVLGIDLGGARMRTTGAVLLEGKSRPRAVSAWTLPKGKTAEAAERDLLELIERAAPDVVAIDAPLTLPPCLTCPAFCRGPSAGLCELAAARDVWEAGGHPVTGRLCEVRLHRELGSASHPLPTMRIGQIAARGVALARRITAGGTRLAPGQVQVLEVYPYATLHRLGRSNPRLRPHGPGEKPGEFAARVTEALGEQVDGLGEHAEALSDTHVLDALVAAWTGWLAPGELDAPPEGFNAASGWIWLPTLAAS